MTINRIFLTAICIAALTPRNACPALQTRSTDFSGCSFESPRDISGYLIAHNAKFQSLTIDGCADLENTTITQELRLTDELRCKECTIGSIYSQAHTALVETTVTGKTESTGTFDCRSCTLQSLTTSDNTTIDTTRITGDTKNTNGSTVATHSKFENMILNGDFKSRTISCKNLLVKGTTSLFKSTIYETAIISGATKCIECFFGTLTIIGKTKLIDSSAKDATITGTLSAENCLFESLTLTGQAATLTNCTADTIYVQKNTTSKALTLTINASEKTNSSTVIKKIVCQDPATRIIYGKGATPAREVIGTNNIQKN